MFESVLLPDAPPDFGPAEFEGWAEPADDETRALLAGLAASYAAAPAAGALPFAVQELPPGPELAGALARCDLSRADSYDVVEVVSGWARMAAWVEANQAKALAELADRAELRPADTGHRSVNPITNSAVVVAGRCQLTARQGENLVGHAVQLVEDFPDTWAMLEAGLVDLRRVRAITDELGGQDPAVRARVEAAVLPKAPFLDAVALRKLIKRLLHELAPVEAAERHRIARDGRYVAVTPASDGMAHLEALLPAEDATALNTALNAAAADARRSDAAAGAPSRTKDQRRADALAGMGWSALAACAEVAAVGGAVPSGTPPMPHSPTTPSPPPSSGSGRTPRRRPIAVHVTVPFATLAGLSDEPGELDGYGPIPAPVARVLASEGVWTWLATDPGTKQVLDLGRTRYRPTKALADFITARDRTCRAPGCHRSARAADIDHIVAFAAGGATAPDNLHALCEQHHLLKHHAGWQVHREPDGVTRWAGRTGHHHRKPPDPSG